MQGDSIVPRLFLLGILLSTITTTTQAYNRPFCGSGWPSRSEWEALETSLASSPLYGPFFHTPVTHYTKQCFLPDQHNVVLLRQGQGLCMSTHSCAQEFCQDAGTWQLPAYSIQLQSVADIQTALAFSHTHDLRVSIKSSGHSYESQSMGKDSLLLWMRHFPQTNVITDDFIDSCDVHHGTTITVAGGQNIDDVQLALGDDYHVVTGSCQSVAIGGGWILGGGLSFTSRQYGYGVDQLKAITMVLADGSVVRADACQNEDLFWAARGGGGGSWGVVTELEYKLHPPTKITTLLFKVSGDNPNRDAFIEAFVTFVVENLPNLERRWGGSIGAGQANFLFVGNAADAAASSFVVDMNTWYDNLGFDPDIGGRPSDLLVEHASWFQYQGGIEAHENPDFDVKASSSPDFTRDTFSRSFPRQIFLDRPTELIALLTDLYVTGDIDTSACYLLGGATSDVDPAATAMHPAMRDATFTIESINPQAAQRVRDFLDGYATSVCYNHHSPEEPDWREASWGSNLPRLESIKATVDPTHRFNVYHGVGYRGAEFGDGVFSTLFADNCPWRNGFNPGTFVRLLVWLRRKLF